MLKKGMPPTYGGAAALDPEVPQTSTDDDRFSDRARALFYARLAFLGIGLAVLASPSWSAFLGITSTRAFIIYFLVIAYSVANFLLIDHPKLGRPLTLATLLLDLVTLSSVVMPSGGLKSPLMAAHVMLTIFLVLLFPRLLAIVPGLIVLPVVAQLNLILQGVVFSQGLFLIVWYATLSLIAAYVLLFLNKRDEKRRHQLQMLSKSQESAIITEERLRLAREIHDGLGGELSTLIMKTEYVQRITKDPDLKQEITEVKTQAEEAIEELRRSLTMMRRDFNLHKALEDYCMRFQERSRTWCVLKVRGRVRRLPSEMQLAVFRILQETLTNIHKHAEAKNTEVRLKYDGDMVALIVQDDGVGFDTGVEKRGHYGLVNMVERVRKFRGTVDVQSAPGAGTTVHATMVIPSEGSHVAFLPEGIV